MKGLWSLCPDVVGPVRESHSGYEPRKHWVDLCCRSEFETGCQNGPCMGIVWAASERTAQVFVNMSPWALGETVQPKANDGPQSEEDGIPKMLASFWTYPVVCAHRRLWR